MERIRLKRKMLYGKRWFRWEKTVVAVCVMILLLCLGGVFPTTYVFAGVKNSAEEKNTVETSDSELLTRELTSDRLFQEDENLSYQRDRIAINQSTGIIYFVKDSFETIEVTSYDPEKDEYEELFSERANTVERYYLSDTAVYFANYSHGGSQSDGTDEYYIRLRKLDFTSKEMTETALLSGEKGNWASSIRTFRVDSQGRAYVCVGDSSTGYSLYLFDVEGALLDQADCRGEITDFFGNDETNGNFYYCERYSVEGGSFGSPFLMAGNVGKNGKMTIPEAPLKSLSGGENPVELLGGRYLAVMSTVESAILFMDSHAYDVQDHVNSEKRIDLEGSAQTILSLNIENQDIIKLAVPTAFYRFYSETLYPKGYYTSSVSANCCYFEKRDVVIVKTGEQMVSEYNLNTGKHQVDLEVNHPVYKLGMTGDCCRIIEKTGEKNYMESIIWNPTGEFSLHVPDVIKVGDSVAVTCDTGSVWQYHYSYAGGDSKIFAVDEFGNLNAFCAGTVELTVTADGMGVEKSLLIAVEDTELSRNGTPYQLIALSGEKTDNIHLPAMYPFYHSRTYSYINPLSSGGWERVEYNGEGVLIESYDLAGVLTGTKKLAKELDSFGGFYAGTEANYIVYGAHNKSESSDTEVLRVVKYDKSWNRIGECSIKGANTYTIFSYGNLDMTETAEKLYVHTCHEMFMTSDYQRHQANCTFVVNENDMTVADSFFGISYFGVGYVSHSYAQLIETDGKNIYRVDLGDGEPRGIGFTATDIENDITSPWLSEKLVEIEGETGENYTGYYLGNMKLSKKYALVAGVGTATIQSAQNNAFLYAVQKDSGKFRRIAVTSYPEESGIQVLVPRLTALSDDHFLLLWEEYDTAKKTIQTKLVLVNGDGSLVSDVVASPLALADDTPMMTEDGMVSWYVSMGDSVVLVRINPYRLSEVEKQSAAVKDFEGKGLSDDTKKEENTKSVQENEITDNVKVKVSTDQKTSVGSGYKKGDVVKKSGFRYKITGSSTVMLKSPVNKNLKKAVIPATIKIGSKKYKVTAVDVKAMKGLKKLTSLTIGKNVKKIGKQAFYNCKKLKNITFRGTLFKSIGKNAFGKVAKKAKITVPKKKFSSYKKLLKKGNVPTTAIFKKK